MDPPAASAADEAQGGSGSQRRLLKGAPQRHGDGAVSEVEVTSNNLLKTAAGVIPHEYGIREDGVRWTAYRPYIAPDGLCISYGNPAEDAANKTVLAAHRENVEALLPRAGEIWDLPWRTSAPCAAAMREDLPIEAGRRVRRSPQSWGEDSGAARRGAPRKNGPPGSPGGLLNRTASSFTVIEPIEFVLRHRRLTALTVQPGSLSRLGKKESAPPRRRPPGSRKPVRIGRAERRRCCRRR